MAKRIEGQLSFFLAEFGETITMDGVERKALIRDVQDRINYYDDKLLRTPFPIKTGDILTYQEAEWLIISEVDRDRKSYRARIRKINYAVHIVLDGDVHTFSTIMEGSSFGIQADRIMSLPEGKMIVTLPASPLTEQLKIDQRFIKLGQAWKITGIDRSRRGLVNLHCELTLFNAYDDKENEIADTNLIAEWALSLQVSEYEVAVGQQLHIMATIKRNGVIVTNKEIVWQSSDEAIAKVENGVVTALQSGEVIITATLADKPLIQASITIEVVATLPDVVTYRMWIAYTDGTEKSYTDFSIFSGAEKFVGVEKYINGVLATPNDTYTFHLDPNGADAIRYTYTVVNQNRVKIKANGIWNQGLILTATSNQTDESLTETIRFVSIW